MLSGLPCFRPHQGINKFNEEEVNEVLKVVYDAVSVPIRGSINLTLSLKQ